MSYIGVKEALNVRVQEMFYIVNHALEQWTEPSFQELKSQSGTVSYKLRNTADLVFLLEPLKPFPVIRKKIDDIYGTDATFYKGETGAFTPQERTFIINTMSSIKSNLLTMQSMCEAIGVKSDSSGFDIKLPPNMTLAELSKCTHDLDNVFNQCPLLKSEQEEVRLRGVDIGSIWVTFSIIGAGSALAFSILKNLAAMVDQIMQIRERAAICKQQEELAKQAQLKNEEIQPIVNANKTIIKNLTQSCAEKLASDNNIDSPEDIAQIRASLDMLREWIEKGMEVYASIEAPKEIKSAFPPLEVQSLPNFESKELEAHKPKPNS